MGFGTGWILVLILIITSLNVNGQSDSINAVVVDDPNTLTWSSIRCDELGYGGKFDYCAELEFCEGEDEQGSNYRERRQLLRRGYSEMEEIGDSVSEEESSDLLTEETNTSHFQESFESVGGDFLENLKENTADATTNTSSTTRKGRKGLYGWRVRGEDECVWPGPLIRLERGRSYGLLVSNAVSSQETNLHTHGLHVAGHGNADDVTRRIGPGDVLLYNYTIPSHHMGGTHWYHSHAHPYTEKQVTGGAFGMLIVEDGEQVMDTDTEDDDVRRFLNNERLLILSNNHNNHDWVASVVGSPEDDNNELTLNPNEWYRVRILMVNTDPNADVESVSLDADHCEVRAIAHDGVLRFEVPSSEIKSDYQLSLSSRLDVALRCQSGPSEIKVDNQFVTTIRLATSSPPDAETATLPVSPFVQGDRSWSSRRPPYLSDWRNATTVDHRWSVRMDETNINDRTYSPTTPLCDKYHRDFEYGDLQEWTVRTSSHPFHLHGQPFQIYDDECGSAHEPGEYYDTLAADSKCKVRMRFLDVAGRTTMHCHVYRHGDSGSMAFINVVNTKDNITGAIPIQPEEPRVHTCVSDAEGHCDQPLRPESCPGLDEDGGDEPSRSGYYYEW